MFTNKQVLFSILIAIASLLIGYWLSCRGSRDANNELLRRMREEFDIEMRLKKSNNQ